MEIAARQGFYDASVICLLGSIGVRRDVEILETQRAADNLPLMRFRLIII